MNFISHDKAYSLYPRETFENRLSLMYSTEGAKQDSARTKYVSRGWKMVDTSSEELCDDPSLFKQGPRYVGDSHCWTLNLSPEFVIPAEINIAKNLIEANTWDLYFLDTGETEMIFFNFSAGSLRFSYTITDVGLVNYLLPVLQNSQRGYVFFCF